MRFAGLRISDVTVLAKESLAGDRWILRTAKTKVPVSIKLPSFAVKALNKVDLRIRNTSFGAARRRFQQPFRSGGKDWPLYSRTPK